jgi:nucleoid-associated protein YgaU
MQNLKQNVKRTLRFHILGRKRAIPDGIVMPKSITAALALALALVSPGAFPQGVLKLQDNAPDHYTVVKGDTLWSISGKFLTEPWRWPEIWRTNQEHIRDPHWIYPGNVIVLDRSGPVPQLRLAGNSSIKLSPQVRSESLSAQAIPAIPARNIEPFLSEPLVVEENGLAKAPRIVAAEESRVNMGAGSMAYVSGFGESKQEVWQVFRPGKPLVDPDQNKTLGYEAIYLGTARVTRAGEPATVRIMSSKQEIMTGDRLVAAGDPAIVQYIPHAPTKEIKGRIIGLYDRLPTSEGGRDSIVSINKGKRDGLEHGHVLAIYRRGAAVPDPESSKSRDRAPLIQLPDERYGLVFVFRIFDSVSYGLVMESGRPVTPGDVVQTP